MQSLISDRFLFEKTLGRADLHCTIPQQKIQVERKSSTCIFVFLVGL